MYPFEPLTYICRTVILADGDFPAHEAALSALRQAEEIVCCDGAAAGLLNYGIEPHHIVGDMDSLSPTLCERYKQRIRHNPDQETNDLTKAIRFCMGRNINEITVLGISGKREDHTLANLSILLEYSQYADIRAITNYGIFNPIRQTTVFESKLRQQISVFSRFPDTLFTFRGLKYPVVNATLEKWWQGSLNEACGTEFTIEMDHGEALIFRTLI